MLGQARQPVTVTVNQLSNCAKKFRGENFVTNQKGEVFPAKFSLTKFSTPLYYKRVLGQSIPSSSSPLPPPSLCRLHAHPGGWVTGLTETGSLRAARRMVLHKLGWRRFAKQDMARGRQAEQEPACPHAGAATELQR